MKYGWVTDRAPTRDDANEYASLCVEVTYANGLLGWEPVAGMRLWTQGQSGVVAWRTIRPAFKAFAGVLSDA